MLINRTIAKQFKFFLLYYSCYFIFGAIALITLFGYETFLEITFTSHSSTLIIGWNVILCSAISSAFIIYWKHESLKNKPLPYFILAIYISNVSLLLYIVSSAILNGYVIWRFPEVLLIFVAPFIELMFAYLYGFALMAVIPALISAYILYFINNRSDH